MSKDNAIERAVSLIYWHLERGHSLPQALANAQEREPDLSESELGQALDSAQAALRFRDVYSQLSDEYDEALATGDDAAIRRLEAMDKLPDIKTLKRRCGTRE